VLDSSKYVNTLNNTNMQNKVSCQLKRLSRDQDLYLKLK